ncbi:orotidine-5'-phosphate decarboxylase [Peptoniphilus sp. oral taxon 386]|uniref:orotidine-5'-phosphate decarboxylase n=1 Tax=Peptoniphilus sp. oral taxon 386 TaxID=652713 RepID=UPI0001DA9CB6|nr:orotidine-5'-phosphate decarboxylase [Peptoniphilus sp. oral taxon 386]EFI42649.1 orotidine 5'-phosphate decarboxylase [Peptoniphilus sp. oral taxon 386 str. F0131]
MNRDVIIALDFESKAKALDFLDMFEDKLYVKVGMELFYKEGPSIIEEIKKRGHKIFLDLKLHDIPNTVAKATISIMSLNTDMINYHIAGGREMLKGAVDEAKKINKDVVTLGITMLTSTSDEMMHDEILIDNKYSVKDTVIKYAMIGKESGLIGVVCSALEVPKIKEILGDEFICVTPGIRLKTNSSDDQKRVVTPEDARELGSDYIVVGRPITKAENPVSAYKEIRKMFLGE